MLKEFIESNLALILLLLLILSLILQQYLQERIKPNKNYLDEIYNVRIFKIAHYANTLFIFCWCVFFKYLIEPQYYLPIFIFYLLILFPFDVYKTKYSFDYLKKQNNSDSTRKYLIYNHCLSVLMLCLLLIWWFIATQIFN